MRNLYIMLDEWNYNKVFIEKELAILKNNYNITIICNDIPDEKYNGISYITYTRSTSKIKQLSSAIQFVFDKDSWKEMQLILSSKGNLLSKFSEILRFYINAELFFSFLKDNNLISAGSNAIYYSYWNFWKCYAITKHRYKYKNIAIISRIHGYDLYKDQIPTNYQPYKVAMYNNLDKLIFIAEHGIDYYTTNFLKDTSDKSKIALSYLGTENNHNLNKYSKNNTFLLVSCSNIIALKCVDRIINALGKIDSINIHWVHFGDGDQSEQIKKLASLILDSKSNITYSFMGRRPNSEIINFYMEYPVDAFITTSSNEGMPMSIMEAFSFGIPVIASPVGNIPQMISDNGILLPYNYSDEDISTAITNMAKMPEDKYIEMRNNARISWENKYVASKNFKEFVDNIIDSL